MKNQIRGLAFILFGILLCLSEQPLTPTLDNIGMYGFPVAFLGIISGLIGVVFVFVPTNNKKNS